MKTHSIALLLVLAACSADVHLDLEPLGPAAPDDTDDTGGTGDTGDTGETDGTATPRSLLVQPAWSMSELPDAQLEHLAWTPDGDLLMASLVLGGYVDDTELVRSTLRRIDPGGALRWASELPMHHEGGGSHTALAATTDGVVVAGVSHRPFSQDVDSGAPPAELHWLDGGGVTVATVALTGASAAPDDDVVHVNSLVALPGGDLVMAGVIGASAGRAFVARLDPEGRELWSVPIEWWSPSTIGTNYPLGPYAATGLTLTADGGLILHGRYYADVAVGDRSASNPVNIEIAGAVYVTRIELDGSVPWLQSIRDLSFAQTGYTSGLAVTDDGHIKVAGMVDLEAKVGDLTLPIEGNNRHYAAELDADGQPVSLIELQYPDGIEWGFVGQTMVVRGGELLLAGQVERPFVAPEPFIEARHVLVVSYDDGGAVQGTFTTAVEAHPVSVAHVAASAVSPQGRLALGGSFAGWADYGQGPVSTPETGDELEPYEGSGYVAVYDPPTPVD